MISRAVGRQSVLSQPPDEFTAHTGLKLESAYIDFAVDDSRPAVKVRQALDNRGIFARIDARGVVLQSKIPADVINEERVVGNVAEAGCRLRNVQ